MARLVCDQQRHRREHGRLVEHDHRRVDERDAGDEREEAVPEGKGVARVQAAVRELVHSLERERAERLELAHPGEVEETVATDLAGDVPERDAEHHTGPEDPPAPGEPLGPRRPPCERERGRTGRQHQHERERQRSAERKGDGERSEQERERPGERHRRPAQPERPADHSAGQQQHARREREPDQRHRSSSSGTRPDASHAAASRYMRPRSPRKTSARSRNATPSSSRARSA